MFQMYIPNKPAKYEIKLYSLTDVQMNYVVNAEVYMGNQSAGPYQRNNKHADVVRMTEPILNLSE